MYDDVKITPARVNKEKGVIEVSKEHFAKLKPFRKDFLAQNEIIHFEHHRNNKNLRRKITGKQVHEFINYLSDCESSNIKGYVALLKSDFRFKLWWYNFKIKFISIFLDASFKRKLTNETA